MKKAVAILLGYLAAILTVLALGQTFAARTSVYKDKIDEAIKANLRSILAKPSHPRLVVDSVDRACLATGDEDTRVLGMLNALMKTSKHTLAVRIKSGYPNSTSVCRESEPGHVVISAHSTAQAFDIFYADGVEIGWQAGNDPARRKAARDKIRQILTEVLRTGGSNRNLLPTQIIVYERDDIMRFSREAQGLYGGYPPQTGLKGMQVLPRCWDRIHIGY